jgi:hypothetical protein
MFSYNIKMESPSNIYKYNLDILRNLEDNQTIYYEDNKIFVDDRYLGTYRAGNNVVKINEIIKLSFIHYFNLLKMGLINDLDEKNKVLELLRESITGLKDLMITYKNLEKEAEEMALQSLKIDLIKILIDFNDESSNKFGRYSSDTDDSDSDSDSENCLRSMLKTTQEHLQMNEHNIIVNTIYVAKNKVVGTLLSIINYIFDMTNF